MNLKETIFGFFTAFDKRHDIQKDSHGRGVLERFNRCLGNDYDAFLEPLNANIIQNVASHKAFERYLPYLGAQLGNISDGEHKPLLFDQRLILKHLERWYAIRGTKRCFKVLFALIGFEVEVIEQWHNFRLDSDVTLDDPIRRFDSSAQNCSDYGLILKRINGTAQLANNTETSAIQSIIAFNHPINAHLVFCTIEGVAMNPNAIEGRYFNDTFDGTFA